MDNERKSKEEAKKKQNGKRPGQQIRGER